MKAHRGETFSPSEPFLVFCQVRGCSSRTVHDIKGSLRTSLGMQLMRRREISRFIDVYVNVS